MPGQFTLHAHWMECLKFLLIFISPDVLCAESKPFAFKGMQETLRKAEDEGVELHNLNCRS